MWELIANGLGLAGTGFSLASGFALDKKVDVIASSLQRLENLQFQLLERVDSHEHLVDGFLPLLRTFGREPNPREQVKTMQMLNEYSRQLQADLKTSTSSLLLDAASEMRQIIDSVRLTHSTEQWVVPRKFTSALYHDPFEAGVVEFQDVSKHGIWGVREPYIVSPHLSPIWWSNPMTGQSFLGKISMTELERYGIKTNAPKYLHTTDGHVYSPEHGLYLPSYFVERFA
jgi:hypothetical protein